MSTFRAPPLLLLPPPAMTLVTRQLARPRPRRRPHHHHRHHCYARHTHEGVAAATPSSTPMRSQPRTVTASAHAQCRITTADLHRGADRALAAAPQSLAHSGQLSLTTARMTGTTSLQTIHPRGDLRLLVGVRVLLLLLPSRIAHERSTGRARPRHNSHTPSLRTAHFRHRHKQPARATHLHQHDSPQPFPL